MRRGAGGGASDRSVWWEERVVSRGSKRTRSSATSRTFDVWLFKLLQVSSRASQIHLKKENANRQRRKREKVKRSELDLFSKCSHILGSTGACPCQKRVGRGGMKSGGVRKSTLCFPPVLAPRVRVNMQTVCIDVPSTLACEQTRVAPYRSTCSFLMYTLPHVAL